MKKINPVWLLCTWVLWFPLLHELGHCLIAWLCGVQVVGLEWNVTFFATDSSYFWQSLWEWSVFVPVPCTVFWFNTYMNNRYCVKKLVKTI